MGSIGGANKVAIITGGASGMGLAVATGLVKRGNWSVHLLDLNGKLGIRVAHGLGPNAAFHKVNATIYSELAQTFDDIFRAEGRLDFVFGNAGMVERFNIYERHPATGPPPELDMRVVDINLKAVFTTSYLALHYFRQSPNSDRVLVLTASCGGLYPTPGGAMYSATKHGVVGYMRSIAGKYFEDGIRVNAICPGTVRTGLIEDAAWDHFLQDCFTPIETIVDIVLQIIDGSEMVDAKGNRVAQGKIVGKTVEASVKNFYFRDPPEFCDEAMRRVMGSTNRESIK